ncbi:Uncharacterized [Syntrophomonas zehnderi OL-4]|uniref:Uncharacterized n=1 Tax=Syntrophomonas zehnderi OL-4 TaxID=690567 RepID=A0A0E4C809_9FIRM|nr:hypothetical protein [Syntrophomonas zehnderi]CFX21225.1 Uncharacterized [Syntrophomonas zehnderi OL-4]
MDNNIDNDTIVAVVAMDEEKVSSGDSPVFLAKNAEEQERLCLLLSRIMGGVAHDLENGVYIIVKH